MKSASLVAAILIVLFAQNTKAANTTFDGNWWVTIDFHEYKNPDGTMALAATREFPEADAYRTVEEIFVC
jgi:hypothetical protein